MATSSPSVDSNLQRSLGRQINYLARTIRWIADHELSETELTTATYLIVRIIYETPGITQNELGQAMQADKATAAKGVAKLESIGYIERHTDPRDGRIRRLYLSEQGREIIPSVQSALRRVTDICASGLSAVELEELYRLLDRVEDSVSGYVSNAKGECCSK